jgi:MFS family permease
MPAPTAAPRDLRVITLVGAAHFTSHLLQLALPPLFPLIRDDLSLSYVSLGLVVTMFYAASGTAQPVSGFIVDRVGARPVLLGGMALLAGATALAGASAWFGMLACLAVLAGLGNGVFHPADYSLLSALVDPRRVGRAFSAHQLAGSLGYAAGPPVVVAIAALGGWRTALAASGALGLAATLLVSRAGAVLGGHRPAARPATAGRAGLAGDVGLLMTAPVLSAFAYFAVFATAQIGLQTFAVTALGRVYDVPLPVVAGVLTAFLLASAAGVVAGGFLVDRAGHPGALVMAGLLLGAAVLLALAGTTLAPLALTALAAAGGFCLGLTGPPRDLMVRASVPAAASGKVFGFAYAGLDVGAALAPLLFGWLVDRGYPRAVFAAAAALLVLTSVTLVGLWRRRA